MLCRRAEARDNTYYSRRIFMKTWKKASVLFFVAALILSVLYAPKTSVAKTKRATPPNAKHYALGDIKSVKLKGSTVTIKADFKKNSKYQTKKFKISSKTKFYHAEEYWYSGGTISKKKFVKLAETAMKDHFPSIHIWVKKNKIVALGESA